MVFRSLVLAIAVAYVRYCFLRHRLGRCGLARTVYFSRGTFSRDVEAMKTTQDVLLNAHILRKLFGLIVAPHRLQQIVCLYYVNELRSDLAPVVAAFHNECERSGVSSICFGGIDYFEVAIFERASSEHGIESVAIFHENYTIPLVLRQTENLISSYPEMPKFSRVYTIGSPAMDILKKVYPDVRPHALTRFRYSQNCEEFQHDLLLVPFSNIAYFAPVAFLITYSLLADLAKRAALTILVKHKNRSELRQFLKSFGRGAGFKHVTNPGASALCASSRVVVCFNSLVYFEALAHGHLIAIPKVAEAVPGELYSQHGLLPEAAQAGIRYFSSIGDLHEILCEARKLTPTDRLEWSEARRALIAKSFFCQ